MKTRLLLACVLVGMVAVSGTASATSQPLLRVSASACKDFANDQIDWSLSWTGDAVVTSGYVQALDPDAQFGEEYWELAKRDQKMEGATSGVMGNRQPWAASLSDVYVVYFNVWAMTPNKKEFPQVIITLTDLPAC